MSAPSVAAFRAVLAKLCPEDRAIVVEVLDDLRARIDDVEHRIVALVSDALREA